MSPRPILLTILCLAAGCHAFAPRAFPSARVMSARSHQRQTTRLFAEELEEELDEADKEELETRKDGGDSGKEVAVEHVSPLCWLRACRPGHRSEY